MPDQPTPGALYWHGADLSIPKSDPLGAEFDAMEARTLESALDTAMEVADDLAGQLEARLADEEEDG